MSELASVFTSMLISFVVGGLALLALKRIRPRLIGRVGDFGYVSCICYVLSLSLPGICWCGALLVGSPDLNDPKIMGIGGGAYGLNYNTYVKAALANSAVVIVGLILSLIASYGPRRAPSADGQLSNLIRVSKRGESKLLLRVIIITSALSVCLFYTVFGWERIWFSEMGRFELRLSNEQLSSLGEMKFFMPLLLSIGTLASFAIITEKSPMLPAFSAGLVCLPFITQASRGFTVIIVMACAALLYRYKAKTLVWVLIMPLVIGYAFYIPLVSRNVSETGLKVFISQHIPGGGSLSGNTMKAADWPIAIAQNVSISYPILVEAMSADFEQTEPVPNLYWILSFMPTVSAIDGFARNYLVFTPFINYYTPYSMYAELWTLHPLILVLFPGLVLYVVLLIFGQLRRLGNEGAAIALLVALIFVGGLIQAQQYPTRTAMRFFFFAYILGLLGAFVIRFITTKKAYHAKRA